MPSFNGTGSLFYGKRNPHNDASFLTTEWLAVLWFPLIPLRTLRVRTEGRKNFALPLPAIGGFFSTSLQYQMLDERKPHVRQVFSTYVFFLALAGVLVFTAMHDWFLPGFLFVPLWLVVPFALRFVAFHRIRSRNWSTEKLTVLDALLGIEHEVDKYDKFKVTTRRRDNPTC
jgi:hypothetical protein